MSSGLPRVLVCYLVPPGEEYKQAYTQFMDSYDQFKSGHIHDRLLIIKGNHGAMLPWLSDWECVRHSNIGLDIGSLQLIAKVQQLDYDLLMWFGSHARILAGDWLARFVAAMQPGVGAVTATASFEAGVTYQMPNPHLRPSALMISPVLLDSLGFGPVSTRWDTYHFEHGTTSLYRTLQSRGLEGVVVGRSGRVYREHEWDGSCTYRQREQEELLIADKHTDYYADASKDERVALALAAGMTP